MKSLLSGSDLAIWITLIVGEVVLCLCIFRRQVLRRLPWFSAYVLASTAKSLLLFALAFLASYATYYSAFYVASHVVSALALLTLFEFGRQVLPGLNLPHNKKALVWFLLALAGIVAFAVLWPLRSLEKRIDVAAYLAVAVSFFFVTRYSRYLGLYWSRLLGGVSFTLGVLYLIDGAAKAMMGHFPLALAWRVSQFSQIANVLAVVAWTVVILLPWGECEMTEDDLRKLQQVVGRMEENLGAFVAKGPKFMEGGSR